MCKIRTLINFLFLINCNEAARILAVFPTPSISHQVVFRPLTLELAKRGHEVTIITPDPQIPNGEKIANLTEIDVHDISYKYWRENVMEMTIGKKDDILYQVNIILKAFSDVFEIQVTSKEVKHIVGGKNQFDLLISETCVRPALAFAHIFNIPAILVSSFGSVFDVNQIIGAPTHPILYPDVTRQKINNLSLWEKVVELYNHYKIQNIYRMSYKNDNEVLKRLFGKNFPTYEELSSYVQMSFLNVHPLWENNRPVPPSVLYIGGVHQKPVKALPKELETYLNSSTNGIIYISFGTNVAPSKLPPERIQILIDVLSELPYDVLWKYDKDTLPGKTENIRLFKWLPQSDLLRHPKIKLFITQGGLQSTDEAITAGVPLIGFPMLGDQWYNVDQYVRHKIGIRLDMDALTRDQFRNSIKTVIQDESYKNNIIRLRTIMYDQPQTALERAVWWTEHVLRHGGAKHLRSPAANISWAEYMELELVTYVLLGLFVFCSLIVIVFWYIVRLISNITTNSIKIKVS